MSYAFCISVGFVLRLVCPVSYLFAYRHFSLLVIDVNIHLSFLFFAEMAPPSYSDLGKQSRDVFGKGYHFGFLKLDIKTKTESGVEFNNEVNFNQESGKVLYYGH